MLEQIGEEIWSAPQPLKLIGADIGTRTVIVRLSDGGLWVHSPARLFPDLRAAVDQLGPVRHIVAPSRFHHLFFRQWSDAYPEALKYGPPGLEKKRPDLKFDHLLDEATLPWSAEIGKELLEGVPEACEYDFFHHRSRTLIITDAFFYIPSPAGWWSGVVASLNGVSKFPTQSRVFRSFMKDRAAVAASFERMAEWPMENMTLCHHWVVRGDALAVFRKGTAWLRT